MDYKLTKEAERDLEEVFFYGFSKWGEESAATFLHALYECFAWLAKNPEIDPFRPEKEFSAYRSWYTLYNSNCHCMLFL